MAGDLFVHLLSGIHVITGSKGPEKNLYFGSAFLLEGWTRRTGCYGRRYTVSGDKEHSAFQVMLRVNFISGNNESGGTKFIGSEGVLTLDGGSYKIHHHKMAKAPGIGDGMHSLLIPTPCRKH